MNESVHNSTDMSEKESKTIKASGRGGYRPNAGRKAGVPNKNNEELRTMILNALDGVGGRDYLERVAESHPQAFVSLLGKVLPTTLDGNVGLTINWPVGVPGIES